MKPIFTIGISNTTHEALEQAGKIMSDKMPDYHVLVYSSNTEDVIFNCFNSDKLEPLDLEEIKEILKAI